jgi:hypothetical protein
MNRITTKYLGAAVLASMVTVAGIAEARADNELLGGLLGGGAGAGIGYAVGGGKGAALGGLAGLAIGALAANQFWRNEAPAEPRYGRAPTPTYNGSRYGHVPPRPAYRPAGYAAYQPAYRPAGYAVYRPAYPVPYQATGRHQGRRDHAVDHQRRHRDRFPSGHRAAFEFPANNRN